MYSIVWVRSDTTVCTRGPSALPSRSELGVVDLPEPPPTLGSDPEHTVCTHIHPVPGTSQSTREAIEIDSEKRNDQWKK